jgi:PadR family transcriptional regulator, regulatory protein PadR
MPEFRLTYPTAMVLQALDAGHRYGFEIADATALRPGSVYQVLRRLEAHGMATGAWEGAERAHAEGRPPRRYYRLRRAAAKEVLDEARRRYPPLDAVMDLRGESPA